MDKRSEEVLSARRESGRWLAQLTQDLAEKTEEAESAGRMEEAVRQEATEQGGRAGQLAIRLREARYGRILNSAQVDLHFCSYALLTSQAVACSNECNLNMATLFIKLFLPPFTA